jgi:iron complex transport system permease protein
MRTPGLLVVLCGVLVGSVVLATGLGPVSVGPSTVARAVGHHLVGRPATRSWSASADTIVWQIRLPRVLLGMTVGAGLAVVGVTFQAMVRNALADPYILGVSSGASTGAASVLVLGFLAGLGPYGVAAGAFAGAMVAVTCVFVAAQQLGRLSSMRLVLAGVAVGGFFSSLTGLIVLTSDDLDAARSVLAWTVGNLVAARWDLLPIPVTCVGSGVAWLLVRARQLNPLSIGDETAASLGIDAQRFRLELVLVASVITASAVAVSGAIGFVGLLVPHVGRLLVGSDHRRLIPISALLGSIALVWFDVAARMLLAPREIPIGVLTTLLGGPTFVVLLRTKGRELR